MTPDADLTPLRAGDRAVMLMLHLYLWASAFGALTLPGTGLTYANAVLPLMVAVALLARPTLEEWIQCLVICGAMVVDAAVREFTYGWDEVGYTINIGKMAIFILVASRFAPMPGRTKRGLVLSFGLAAIASEVFAVFNPDYRLALFNADRLAEGFGLDLFRPTGLIGDPNYFALPVCMMAVAAYQCGRRALLVLALLFVVASGSRSAAIAALVPIFLLQMARSSHRPMRMVAIALLYVGGAFAVAAANQILRDNTGSESTAERLDLLVQGVQNIASFSFLDATYGQPRAHALDGQLLVIHNTFLQTLSTSFVLGVFFLIRTLRGFLSANTVPLLLCLVIEMLFLDLSSHSGFVLLFLLLTASAQTLAARPAIVHDHTFASYR